jgi:PAS domain S-box-containing protein
VAHRLQDSFFTAVFNSRVAGIAIGSVSTREISATNTEMLRIVGRPREDVEGGTERWREFTPPEYHHLDEAAFEQFLTTGRADPFEKEYVRPDGSRVPVRISVSGVDNDPDRLLVFVQDISAEHAARDRERQVQKRLQIALSAADQGVWDWDLISNEMVYDDRAKQIYGLPLDQPVTFEIIRDATHPEDLPFTHAQMERAIDPKIRDRNSYEYRILRPDGSTCWALAHGEAVFEGEGESERAIRYAGTIQDISERKAAERHQQILIAELNHRVKNTLALVQALAHQTFKGQGVDTAVQTFSGRLAALAAAHSILTRAKWDSAKVKDVAGVVLRPLVGNEQERIRLSGGDESVPPQLAVSVAMALHELGTNAVKYGALSDPHGRVDVEWSIAEHSEPRLHLRWREHDGPPVMKPEHEGFGTRMLKRILASELSGTVKLDFSPDGLDCSIDAPVRRPSPVV